MENKEINYLVIDNLEISPIDKDGDFEITIEHDMGFAYHYLKPQEAKQLIKFLQQGLDSFIKI